MKVVEQAPHADELQALPLDAFGPSTDFTTHTGTGKIARAEVEWEYRVPEELSRDSSVIIAHGYFAKQEVYDGLADALASQGVATATYKAVRRQSMLAGLHPKHLTHPARLVCQAPWAAIRDIRKHHAKNAPTDKFTFVGHSMGGPTSLMNALTHPDSIDGVVIVDGAGLEDQTTEEMAGRLPGFFANEVLPALRGRKLDAKQKAELVANSLLYLAYNPARTLAEGIAVANVDIRPHLPKLEQHGIPSAVIVSSADTLVKAPNVVASSGHLPDYLHVMPWANLGHLGPLVEPQKYGSALLQVLQNFDARKESTSGQTPPVSLAA